METVVAEQNQFEDRINCIKDTVDNSFKNIAECSMALKAIIEPYFSDYRTCLAFISEPKLVELDHIVAQSEAIKHGISSFTG